MMLQYLGLDSCSRAIASVCLSAALAAVIAAPPAVDGSPAKAAFAPSAQPLLFEENRGQGPADAAFVARGAGFSAAFTPAGFRIRTPKGRLIARFEGASPAARPRSADPAGSAAYFLGADRDRWVRSTPRFRRIGFEDVYPGVDVVYYAAGDELEFDFELDPGADPGAIRLQVGPATLTPEGDLLLQAGALRLRRPVAYQLTRGGERREVSVAFRRGPSGQYGFTLGAYDRDRPLVIDPRVGLSTFLGGTASDRVRAVAIDADGSIWAAGETASIDFPQAEGAFPQQLPGATDVFVTRLERDSDASGEASWRVAATAFIGGAGVDRVVDLEATPDGRVFLFGDTASGNFPVSNDAEQPALAGGVDLFLMVVERSVFPFLTPEGAPEQSDATSFEIVYSTLLGGAADETAFDGLLGPFVDGPLCAAVAGLTRSDDFPVDVFATQSARAGAGDAALAVVCEDPTAGGALRTVYGTYLGGSSEESAAAVGVTADGAFCLGVRTASDELPAEDGLQDAPGGGNDLYLACFAPVRRRFGLPFLYRDLGRTYLGGVGDDRLVGLVVERGGEPQGLDPAVRLFAAISSSSANLDRPPDEEGEEPTMPLPELERPAIPEGTRETNPGLRSVYVFASDGFLGERLTEFWVGGSADDDATAFAGLDGCLALAGRSQSADLPVSELFPQAQAGGGDDALLAKFCFDDQLNGATEYLGLFGGVDDEEALTAALSPAGVEVFGGLTSGGDFPTADGAVQASFQGGAADGFVLELFRPQLTAESVVGAADFRGGEIAPGQILSVFGSMLGPDPLVAAQPDAQNRFPRRLGTTRVLFEGAPAPLLAASSGQINLVAPFSLDGSASVQLQVEVDGTASRPVRIPVTPRAPGAFTLDRRGTGQAAVLNQDFSVNGPGASAPGGSVIQAFITGAGQTDPPGVDAELAPTVPPFPRLRADVRVRIAGREAVTLYAGGAPGLTNGLTQINIRVPPDLTPDPAAPLQIAIGGVSIQPGVTIAVR